MRTLPVCRFVGIITYLVGCQLAFAAATSLTYGGLEHAALGLATLELEANGAELAVGNLGSSGQDGVAITLPPKGRWDAQWQPLDVGGTAPKGAYLQGTVLGTLGDGSVGPLGVVTTTKLGPEQYGLTADFSALAAATCTVEVYDGAKLVSRLTGQGGNLVTSSLPNFDLHISCCPFTIEVTWRGGGGSGTLLTFAGGSSVYGDRLVLTPENGKEVSALAAMELRASGLPQIHFVPPQPAATSLTYGGLEHAALGLATLELQSNGTELAVGNLGSSGQDGVAITLPPKGRWDAQWQPLDVDGTAPKGAYLQGTVLGALGDGSVGPLGVVTTTKLGPEQYGLTADFSALGAATCTVEVYDGAKLVSRLTGQGGNLVTSGRPNWDCHISCCPFTIEVTWRGGGGSGTLLTFAGGSSVYGDRLVLTPENGKEVSALAAMELRASGLPQIHFVPPQPAATSLTYGGLEHAALGLATLELQSNGTELAVGNLGSSGQDGVAITLPPKGRWDAQWQPLDVGGTAPKGAYLQGTVLGALGDGSVGPLGVVTTTKLGPEQYGLTADFSALGAATCTVEVYDGAKLVSRLTGQGGNLVTSSLPNFDLHISCCPFTIEVTWRGGGGSGTLLTFAGGSSVYGDRLVLTPENGKEVSALAAMELRASGLPQIHFVPPQPAATSLTYGGLEHAALGLATLELQSNGTELAVGNLGSSGQDGVAITLPPKGRWDAQWQPLDVGGTAPKGAYLQGTVLGALGDGSVGPLGVVTTTKLGPEQYGLTADFSALGAATCTVEVYDGAKLVSRLTGQGGNLVTSGRPNWDCHISCCPFTIEVTWRGGGGSGTLLTFAGGSSVYGDRLVLTPENGKEVSALAAMELRASGLPQIHFVPPQPAATSLTYGGLEHAALGLATLELQSNGTELAVGNLGSSGQDGVAITLPPKGRWDAQWQPLDVGGTAPKGAYLQGTVLGTLGDGSVGPLGVVTTTKLGPEQYGLTADFSALGAATCTVEVYDGAKLVSRLTGQGGNLVTSGRPNWDCHISCCPFTIEVTWRGGGGSGTLLTFAGGSSVYGDRLVLTPENGKEVSALAAMELRASGLPQIHFVPPQPAATSLTYGGLEHAALGLATLELQSNGTELAVGNLGSSGQDGVAITLPPKGRWDAQWQPLDVDGTAPKGAYLQGTVLGALGDGSVGPLGVVTTTKLGPEQYGLTADFSALGAATCTVEVYDGAKLVSRLTGQGGNLVTSGRPNWDCHISCCPFTIEVTWRGGGGSGTLLTFAGGSSVYGDRLVLTPENGKEVSALAAMELRASGLPQIHFVPPQPAATSLTYGGLEHAALGLATLELQSNGTELAVGNLGSSGQDGVAITLPPKGRWDAQWQPLDVDGTAPKGAYLQGTVLGALGDGSVGPLGVVTTTKLGPEQYGLTADFSALGAATCTVEVYDGAKLVSRLTGQGGNLVTSGRPNWDCHISCCPFTIEVTWRGGGGSGTLLTFAGGSSVYGDRLVLTPENGKEVSALAAMELRASGLPQIHFVPPQPAATSLTYGGLEHAALGLATLELEANGAELAVGNLGSSGQDGVAIGLKRADRWDAIWLDTGSASNGPVGARMQIKVLGSTAGTAGKTIGTVNVTKTADGTHQIEADFSSLGATSRTAQVYLGSNLVAQVTHQIGPVGTAIAWPKDIHIRSWPISINLTYGGASPASVELTLNGGTTVKGDRLVLIPEQAPVVDYFSEVQLRASGIPNLVMVSQETVLVPLQVRASLSGDQLILQWPGSGVLEESTDLKHWTPMPAISPFLPASDGLWRFYRVVEATPAP